MSNARIQALLEQLRSEIQNTDIDAQTQSLMQDLDKSIHELANNDDTTTIAQRARQLEGKFAANHPTAERLVAEVINTLSKMGI